MPPRQAAELRVRLPRPLARLVTDLEGLAAIDPAATAPLLEDAAAIVLAGSADRDLALAIAAKATDRLVNRA